jgi:hypothetical protein
VEDALALQPAVTTAPGDVVAVECPVGPP